eukprot:Nk52_evm18s280 gene=Nk52_evmTU18s280
MDAVPLVYTDSRSKRSVSSFQRSGEDENRIFICSARDMDPPTRLPCSSSSSRRRCYPGKERGVSEVLQGNESCRSFSSSFIVDRACSNDADKKNFHGPTRNLSETKAGRDAREIERSVEYKQKESKAKVSAFLARVRSRVAENNKKISLKLVAASEENDQRLPLGHKLNIEGFHKDIQCEESLNRTFEGEKTPSKSNCESSSTLLGYKSKSKLELALEKERENARHITQMLCSIKRPRDGENRTALDRKVKEDGEGQGNERPVAYWQNTKDIIQWVTKSKTDAPCVKSGGREAPAAEKEDKSFRMDVKSNYLLKSQGAINFLAKKKMFMQKEREDARRQAFERNQEKFKKIIKQKAEKDRGQTEKLFQTLEVPLAATPTPKAITSPPAPPRHCHQKGLTDTHKDREEEEGEQGQGAVKRESEEQDLNRKWIIDQQRYAHALQEELQRRADAQEKRIPPLCPCHGEGANGGQKRDLWDSSLSNRHCANNCCFFHNDERNNYSAVLLMLF